VLELLKPEVKRQIKEVLELGGMSAPSTCEMESSVI
jgi:hypothetical protein